MPMLVYGDLHLHKWTEFSTTTDDGGNSRLQDGARALKKVKALCIKHGIEEVISNGDYFHKRIVMDVQTYNTGHDGAVDIAEVADEYFNPGNHDQSDNEGAITSVSTFAAIPRVRVVGREPAVFEIGLKVVMFIPYMMKIDDVRAAFRDGRKADIIFYHGGIDGARTGTIEYKPREELKLEEMPKKPLVLCSHYHKRQQMRSNVWYIGAPMQHNRGDAYDVKRGCCIIGDDLKLHWINFSFPRFVTLTHVGSDDPDLGPAAKGNFVDVIYDPRKYEVESLREFYAAHEPRGVKFIPHVPQTLGQAHTLGGAPVLDYNTLVDRHVEHSKTKLNKTRLRRMAQRWLNQ